MTKARAEKPQESQAAKFATIAAETQCDVSELAFDDALRKIAKPKPKDEKPAK